MRYAAILFLALVLAGCGPSAEQLQATVTAAIGETQVAATATAEADACSVEKLGTYADTIEKQISRFIRQTSVAGSSPRMSMGGPLQELLNLQNDTEDMKHPACLDNYHRRVVSMMGMYRLGYENFAAQGDETMTTAALKLAEEDVHKLQAEIAMIRRGEVPPLVELDSTPTP